MFQSGSHSQLLANQDGAYSQLIRFQENNISSEFVGVNLEDNSNLPRELSIRQSSQRSLHQQSITQESASSLGESSHLDNAEKIPVQSLAYLNKPEIPVLVVGAICAIIYGIILPIFGILMASMVKTFYEPPPLLKPDSRYWTLMFVLLGLISFLVAPARSYFFAVAGCKLTQRIRSMCFEKILSMEVGWFDEPQNSCGAIGARLSSDAAVLRSLVGDALAQVVQDGATAVAGLGLAFAACWQLALIVVAMVPLIGLNDTVQRKFTKGFTADTKVRIQLNSYTR